MHTWGRPCDIGAIEAIAARHNLRVIFDGAHAMGCSYGGQKLGAFGDAEVLSFHATKVLNSFEGGAVLTNNAALANDVRLMRNFGFAGVRLGKAAWRERQNVRGIGAAMGLTLLESFDRFCRRNRRNYELYREGLKSVPGLRLYQYDSSESHNYHYIIVECDRDAALLSRDELVRFLETENVLARRYFYPGCHHMQPYASLEPRASLRLVNTERLTKCVMALPNGTAVNVQVVGKICALLRTAQENASMVREGLAQLLSRQQAAREVASPSVQVPARKAA